MLTDLPVKVAATLTAVGLRELRQAQLLSQRELAAKAGVAAKTIADIETGKIRPHPATLRKIAAALGVGPSALAEYLERPSRPDAEP
jgi:transcriptional regulator with XRE-family HTH domain